MFVLGNGNDKFQTHIGRAKFQSMNDSQVNSRLQSDCEWWDAKVNNINSPFEPSNDFNDRIATFVGDEFIV